MSPASQNNNPVFYVEVAYSVSTRMFHFQSIPSRAEEKTPYNVIWCAACDHTLCQGIQEHKRSKSPKRDVLRKRDVLVVYDTTGVDKKSIIIYGVPNEREIIVGLSIGPSIDALDLEKYSKTYPSDNEVLIQPSYLSLKRQRWRMKFRLRNYMHVSQKHWQYLSICPAGPTQAELST